MKKILIKNDIISGGGVEIVMRDLVYYLVDKGDNVTIVVDDGNKKDFYKIYPKCVRLLSRCYDGIKKKTPLYRIINHFVSKMYRRDYIRNISKKYDVAIAIKDGPSMKYVADLNASRKIAWIHADYDYCHWPERWFESTEAERLCMEKFNKVVCVSEAAKQSVIRNVGDSQNLCVRLNPLNVANIKKQADFEIIETKPKEKMLFVSIGKLSEQKNYLQLVDAVSLLSDEERDKFEIWIIGDGEQREEIEQKIADKKIECIKLLGWKTNPYPYIKKADCFLSVATWESFGLAIQEALILGVPVLSTWWPALDEVFDNRFGIITKCDAKEISISLKHVFEDDKQLLIFRNNIKMYFDTDQLWNNRLSKIYGLIGNGI